MEGIGSLGREREGRSEVGEGDRDIHFCCLRHQRPSQQVSTPLTRGWKYVQCQFMSCAFALPECNTAKSGVDSVSIEVDAHLECLTRVLLEVGISQKSQFRITLSRIFLMFSFSENSPKLQKCQRYAFGRWFFGLRMIQYNIFGCIFHVIMEKPLK